MSIKPERENVTSRRLKLGPIASAWLSGAAVFVLVMIGMGYVLGPATCRDGWHSASVGRRGACSHHGGVDRSGGTLRLLMSIGAGVGTGFLVHHWLVPKPASANDAPSKYSAKPMQTGTAASRLCPRCNTNRQNS